MEAEPLSDQDAAAEIEGEGRPTPRRFKSWYLGTIAALLASDDFVQQDAALADETNRRTPGHVPCQRKVRMSPGSAKLECPPGQGHNEASTACQPASRLLAEVKPRSRAAGRRRRRA